MDENRFVETVDFLDSEDTEPITNVTKSLITTKSFLFRGKWILDTSINYKTKKEYDGEMIVFKKFGLIKIYATVKK